MKCYNKDERFEYLSRDEDFALARDKENNTIVIVYDYDAGYQYHVTELDKLLNIDTDKLVEQWLEAIGNMITSTRPYKNNFPFLKEGDKHE